MMPDVSVVGTCYTILAGHTEEGFHKFIFYKDKITDGGEANDLIAGFELNYMLNATKLWTMAY